MKAVRGTATTLAFTALVVAGGCQLVSGLSGLHETGGTGGTSSTSGGGMGGTATASTTSSTTSTTSSTTSTTSSTASTTSTTSSTASSSSGGCGDTTSDAANCGKCGHDCEGGHCVMGICGPTPFVTVTSSGPPGALASDGSFLYWSTFDGIGGSALQRRPVGGGTVDTIVSSAGIAGDVAVDGTWVYWLDLGGQYLKRTPSAGGAIDMLCAVDPLSTELRLSGTRLFWNSSVGITSVASTGGMPKVLNTPMTTAARSFGLDDLYLTFVEGPGFGLLPLNGMSPLAIGTATGVTAFTADSSSGGYLYWMEQGGHSLRRTAKDGSGAGMGDLVAQMNTAEGQILVTKIAVYWSEPGMGCGTNGYVYRMALPALTGAPVLVKGGVVGCPHFAADATAVYFNDDKEIDRLVE